MSDHVEDSNAGPPCPQCHLPMTKEMRPTGIGMKAYWRCLKCHKVRPAST